MTVKVTVQIDGGKTWTAEADSENDVDTYNRIINLLLLYANAMMHGYAPVTIDPFQSEEPREP